MAYNPFDFFRRNQKTLFAFLTVFIMIMFTLSFGANDFFQWFPKWLGTRSSGDVMAVVDGGKVRASDLDDIQKQRTIANRYMLAAAENTNAKLSGELAKLIPVVSEANRGTIAEFATLRRTGFIPEQFLQFLDNPQLQQFVVGMQRDNITRVREGLNRIVTANSPKPEDLDAAQLAQALLAFDTNPPRQGLYFTDAPNANRGDALDFLLWRKKADQLGIAFTREDVEQLVDSEFLRFDSVERARALSAVAEERRGLNAGDVYGYLADEFRVRAAQQAVLGASFVRADTPPPLSPDQQFARFQETTEAAKWSVATLPVSDFTNQVAGAPTPQEMTDIFRKGQNIEPDPSQSRPALKKPRELKVGWLEVTGKEPYYVAAANEAVAKIEPAVDVAHLLVAPLVGGPLGQVAGVGVTAAPDKLLLAEYARYKQAEIKKSAAWPPAPRAFEPRKTDTTAASLARAEHAAALVGLAAATPLTAGLSVQLRAERIDDTYRFATPLPALAPALLGGPTDLASFVMLDLVTRQQYPELVAPQPPPLSAMRETMAARVRETFQFSTLPVDDMEKLMTDTAKAVADANTGTNKEQRKAAAKPILDAFVATRKLADLSQVGESAGFADIHSVNRDPGLEKLRTRFAGPHAAAGGAALDNFGRVFFKDTLPAARGMPAREVDSQRFFTPRTYPEPSIGDLTSQSQYLVWLTDEVPAAASRRMEEVKDQIEAVWRRQKARELAKAAAEKLAAEVAKLKPDAATLSKEWPDLAKAYGPVFAMPPLAGTPLKPVGAAGYDFEQYQWPREFIKYPSRKMAEELMELRNKPFGTTVVDADQPENAYYVFVLAGRSDQLPVDYANVAYAPAVSGAENPAGEQLPTLFVNQARRAAIDDALALLRSEYNLQDEDPKLREKQE